MGAEISVPKCLITISVVSYQHKGVLTGYFNVLHHLEFGVLTSKTFPFLKWMKTLMIIKEILGSCL